MFNDDELHTKPRPFHINQRHWREWVVDSQIDPEITALNLRSLSERTAYDYLLYSDQLSRRNDARLSNGILKRYQHLDLGGWWCNGINVLTGKESLWGCGLPDSPDLDLKKGKFVKYEHPDVELFKLKELGKLLGYKPNWVSFKHAIVAIL